MYTYNGAERMRLLEECDRIGRGYGGGGGGGLDLRVHVGEWRCTPAAETRVGLTLVDVNVTDESRVSGATLTLPHVRSRLDTGSIATRAGETHVDLGLAAVSCVAWWTHARVKVLAGVGVQALRADAVGAWAGGAHEYVDLAVLAGEFGRTCAEVGAVRVGLACAEVLARTRLAQVDLDLAVGALVAGRTGAQVARARVVVARGAVEAWTAGTGLQCNLAVGACVAGRTGAVVAACAHQFAAVASLARVGLAGGYELVAVGAAVAGAAQADVLQGRWDLLACAALGAQAGRAWVNIRLA